VRTFGIYSLLVIMPLVAVLGVVHYGQGLRPPASVAGAWDLALELEDPSDGGCTAWPNDGALHLTILQSGSHVLLTITDLPSATMTGEVAGATLSAGGAWHAGKAGGEAASAMRTLEVHAQFERGPGVERLLGVVYLDACPGEQGIPFTAVRPA
jgi:hypothetical protein